MTGVCNAGILGYTQAEVDSLLSTMANAISIYVSPDGDDNNDGTEQSPIKTYERAMEIVQKYPASSWATIRFAPGIYDISPNYRLTGRPGVVELVGESRDTTIIRSTTRGPIFEAVGAIYLNGLCFQLTDATSHVLSFYDSRFSVANCKITTNITDITGSTNLIYGVYAAGSFGGVVETEIQNCQRCIQAYFAFVAQRQNTGNNNTIALSTNDGIVLVNGSIPTATTTYNCDGGGCINPVSNI